MSLKLQNRPVVYFSDADLVRIKETLTKIPGIKALEKDKKNLWGAFIVQLLENNAAQQDQTAQIAALQQEKTTLEAYLQAANDSNTEAKASYQKLTTEVAQSNQTSETLVNQGLQRVKALEEEVTKKSRELDARKLGENQVVITLRDELVTKVRNLRTQLALRGLITRDDETPSALFNNCLQEVIRIFFPDQNTQP